MQQSNTFVGLQKHAEQFHIANPIAIPSGSITDAANVLSAFTNNVQHNKGIVLLSWALGTHLKQHLGFYPHLQVQNKGALAKLLNSNSPDIFGRPLSHHQLRTDASIVAALSGTSYPTQWVDLLYNTQAQRENAYTRLHQANGLLIAKPKSDATLLSSSALIDTYVFITDAHMQHCSVNLHLENADILNTFQTPAHFPMWEWFNYLSLQDPKLLSDKLIHKMTWLANHYPAKQIMAIDAQNFAAVALAYELLADFTHTEECHTVYHAIAKTITTDVEQEVYHA